MVNTCSVSAKFLIVIKDLIDLIFGSKKLSRSDDQVSPIGKGTTGIQ